MALLWLNPGQGAVYQFAHSLAIGTSMACLRGTVKPATGKNRAQHVLGRPLKPAGFGCDSLKQWPQTLCRPGEVCVGIKVHIVMAVNVLSDTVFLFCV